MINHELVWMEIKAYFISKFMSFHAQKHIRMLTKYERNNTETIIIIFIIISFLTKKRSHFGYEWILVIILRQIFFMIQTSPPQSNNGHIDLINETIIARISLHKESHFLI